MIWWQTVLEFAKANSSSLIVSLIVGILFFVLGPIGLWFSGKKIRRERICKAKDSMVDLLEGMLVNQENVTPEKLDLLFNAVGREIDVNLNSVYDGELLIEDVMLRFQKSKHLDAQQKQDYFAKLKDVRLALHEKPETTPQRSLPRRDQEIIDDLRARVGEQKEVSELIDELQNRIERKADVYDPILDPFILIRRMITRDPKRFALIFFFVVIFYIAFVLFVVGVFE
jgi:ABC-type multidrug transport system fused ATPase/permease subunit